MTEILSYGFMQRAFIAGIAMALFAGVISTFIVLRRVSFLGSGISHAAFGGVAIGFLSGINPLTTALIYCVAVAFAIEVISTKGKLAEDTAIGVFFSGSMAMGVVLISLSRSYTTDLFGYLFGSILAISSEETYIAVAMAVAGILVFSLIMKDLLFITFNEELAIISGIPVRLIKACFLFSMAVVIVIGIKIVGIVLISALLVIPGATAKLLGQKFYGMILISAIVAVISTILGLVVSYAYDLASGGTIVMMLVLFFGIAFLSRKRT
jgi:zinc transport system permease protein